MWSTVSRIFSICDHQTVTCRTAPLGPVRGPAQWGDGRFEMINNKRLTYAKLCSVASLRGKHNHVQANSQPLGASNIMDCTQVHIA